MTRAWLAGAPAVAVERPIVVAPSIAVAVMLMFACAGDAAADPLPRIDHVTRALAAVRALGPDGRDKLDRELYTASRAQCHGEARTPEASCLIAAARATCKAAPERAPCEAAADVIITNLRAAHWFVDEPTRVRLVRGSTDYRAALAGELRRRYATLAAELVLAGAGATGTAAAIDALCAGRDRELHACAPGDTACMPSLPWSRCVAALVWFIGGGP